MRHLPLAALASIAVLLAACAGGGSPSDPPSSVAPAATPAPTAAATALATRVEVTLTDTLRIEPAGITVPAGVPVTFVVTNAGAIEHEFVLGDKAAQAEHEMEMSSTGMSQDEEMAIGLDPGETKELTVTFPAATTLLAGCHVAGHYAGGMKAAVEVVQ
jgi:uncharacterized cupredoxin-like copper-binding protein